MDLTFWTIDCTPHMTRGEARAAVRMASRRVGRNVCYGKDSPSAPAADPNIGIAARENAALSKEMADVAREELVWNKARWEEVKPVYNQVIQTELAQMKQSGDRGTEQWEFYKKLFQPVEEKMVADANAYDSPERKERMAAAAAADVSGAHDAAAGITRRTMESMGVNPNDPKYGAVMNNAGLVRARDTAGAMNTARTNTELTGMSMRQGVAQFGRNMPQTSIAQDAATLNAGNSATGNVGAQNAGRAAAVGSAAPWYSGAVNANTQAGNLLQGQYNSQLNAWNMNNQNQNAGMAGIGKVAGTALGYWASTGFATKDGGIVRRNYIEGTPGGDGAPMKMNEGGLVRRKAEAAGGTFTAGDTPVIEGEYSEVDSENSIDPTDGEIMEALASGGGLKRDINYAGMPRRMPMPGMTADGVVDGPGSTTSDSVSARLSKDEAVLNAEAVKLLGEDFINRINKAGLQRRRAVTPDGVFKYESLPEGVSA